jgi:phage baseplate assembly protein V
MELDLLALLDGNLRVLADDGPGGQPRVYGVVVAVVTSVDDDQQLGRVRVRFSFGGRTESAWARIASPWAGPKQRGAYFVPEVDDEVLVAFADGNLGHPYVLGFLWSQPSPPPETSPKAGLSVIRSARGHRIELDDNKGLITLRTKGDTRVVLDDSTGKVTIDAKGSIEINSTTDLSLVAKKSVSIKGADVSINADNQIKLN